MRKKPMVDMDGKPVRKVVKRRGKKPVQLDLFPVQAFVLPRPAAEDLGIVPRETPKP